MSTSVLLIWVQLGAHVCQAGGREAQHGPLLFAAVYRQWGVAQGEVSQLAVKQEQLDILIKQIEKATESTSGVAIMGDLNMDALRKMDDGYYRRALLSKFLAATERVGLEYVMSPWTSCLDDHT
jgi:hypothetical protein